MLEKLKNKPQILVMRLINRLGKKKKKKHHKQELKKPKLTVQPNAISRCCSVNKQKIQTLL